MPSRDESRNRFRKLRIVAQDPSLRGDDGRTVVSEIPVPYEALQPGPWGHRVQVVDYDAASGALYAPLEYPADGDPFRDVPPEQLLGDPQFHQQNVYAIATATLGRFERALGRRVAWSFKGHQLKIAPHAFAEANAYYSRRDEAVLLGWFRGRDGPVFTCLSHDVVAHEVSHALVDGLRQRYADPSSPDQAAFHEGFSDVVALLSVFALPDVVGRLLAPPRGAPAGRLTDADLAPAAIAARLLALAEQFGSELQPVRGAPLRASATLVPSQDLLGRDEFRAPHRRGEVFVAAMMRAFVAVWLRRVAALRDPSDGTHPAARVVEEGALAASTLLSAAIRALDYCPAVDLQFADFLSAFLTSDGEIRPDDRRWGYREAVRTAFAEFGVFPAAGNAAGTWSAAPDGLDYSGVRFEGLQRDPDEVFRLLWENRRRLRLEEGVYTRVLSVRPCVRSDEEGFTLRETVAEYVQIAHVRASELSGLGIAAPRGLSRSQVVPVYGGGVLLFDDFGRLKYQVWSSIRSDKQTRRLAHLWRTGALRGAPARRFADLHRARATGGR